MGSQVEAGAVWHDGSPFTADDVTYTYGAILSRNARICECTRELSDHPPKQKSIH